jgi:hypothetical protein
MSDSDFEQINLSDAEEDDENVAQVIMEFGESFLRSGKGPGPEKLDEVSTSSAFIQVKLSSIDICAKLKPDEDKGVLSEGRAHEEHNSFPQADEHSECSFTEKNSTASAAEFSTISDFDLLSIGGTRQFECKRCSIFNSGLDVICSGCGIALVPNPCLEADAQLAKSMEMNEKKRAFDLLKREETMRKQIWEQPLLFQAETLTRDILEVVRRYEPFLFNALPEADLMIQASRFIEFARNPGTTISLAYHFSTNTEQRLDQIRADGFVPPVETTVIEEVTQQSFDDSADTHRAPTVSKNGSGEGRDDTPDEMGWILAFLGSAEATSSNDRTLKVTNETRKIWKMVNSTQCLPIICFEPLYAGTDDVCRLYNSLSQVCFDFFSTDWVASERMLCELGCVSDSPRKKKVRRDDYGKDLATTDRERESSRAAPSEARSSSETSFDVDVFAGPDASEGRGRLSLEMRASPLPHSEETLDQSKQREEGVPSAQPHSY